MNIDNEQKETVYRFDVDLSPEEHQILVFLGKEMILKDEAALINYAVNKILEEQVKAWENIPDKPTPAPANVKAKRKYKRKDS